MHLMIDFDAIARVIALIGGVFLFVLWVLVSRNLVGFLLVLAGEVRWLWWCSESISPCR